MWARPVRASPWVLHGERALLLLLVLAAFLFLNSQIPGRLASISSPLREAFYLLVIASCLASLLACITAKPAWAGVGLALAVVNLLVGGSFLRIRGRSLTLMDSQVLLEGLANTGDALRLFAPSILVVLLQTIGLLWLLLLARRLVTRRSNLPLFLCSAVMVTGYFGSLFLAGDTAVGGFPNVSGPALEAVTLIGDRVFRRIHGLGGPAAPLQALPLDPSVRHLVLVIDESVEGGIFNGLLETTRVSGLRDLGPGYSYANSSACSNLMLRRGADPLDAGRTARQYPSLFQLAQRSGFSTSYLDCQGVLDDPTVQDYFDDREKACIGTIVRAKTLGNPPERDINGIDALVRLLARPGRSFTIVNKEGTHFPYHSSLPPGLATVSNPYEASLQRSSVQFLLRLGGHLPEGTLVFYTSDHGQNFVGTVPHGNLPGECVVSEWIVPCVLLASPDLQARLDHIDPRWKGRASHASLAESVRNLLGARCTAITSLWSAPHPGDLAQHRAFYGSPMGLFGRPVPYLTIDMEHRTLLDPMARAR